MQLAVVAPSEAPTCHQASTAADPAALIGAFRAARLQGRDAEECLTAGALAKYGDARCNEESLGSSPGPIVLYSCAGHRVVVIPDGSIQRDRGAPYMTEIEVDLDGRNSYGQSIRLYEHLTIGPGTPAGGGPAVAQLITAVDNN